MPLNKLQENDLLTVLAWRNSPEVRRYMFSNREISEADHRSWFRQLADNPSAFWYLHQNDNYILDGVVYFTEYCPDKRSAVWGFYAAPSALPGAGSKIGLAALDKAFGDLNLLALRGEVLEDNERSLRFHEKLGFSRAAGGSQEGHFDGKSVVGVIHFEILKLDWFIKRPDIEKRISRRNRSFPSN